MFTICPACVRRYAHLINPDCAVCGGAGRLQLGAAALADNEPAVVARAIAIALEAEARDIELKIDHGDDKLVPLRGTMGLLYDSGILGRTSSPVKFTRRPTAAKLAAQLTEVPVLPVDETLIEAKPHQYGRNDRPNARGLPLLSASGHPSHLARITDPAEVGGNTARTVMTREVEGRAAVRLAAAAPQAIKMRKRKK